MVVKKLYINPNSIGKKYNIINMYTNNLILTLVIISYDI